jgi:hypothetical protein
MKQGDIDMSGESDDSTLRIGQFFLRIGAMTQEQVDEVLERQKQEPQKLFGQIASELGYVRDDALDRFAAEK